MKNWDNRQIKTFFCLIVFGFLMIITADAFDQLVMVSSIMLGIGTVFSVNMMPKEEV